MGKVLQMCYGKQDTSSNLIHEDKLTVWYSSGAYQTTFQTVDNWLEQVYEVESRCKFYL